MRAPQSQRKAPIPKSYRKASTAKKMLDSGPARSRQQENLLLMQQQLGNATVQRMLANRDGGAIQRYGLGDLWSDVKSVASEAWETLTGPGAGPPGGTKKKAEVTGGLHAPPGVFTIQDPQAILRIPPPSLSPQNGKPLVPAGTQVELVEAARKKGKYYVSVREFAAPGGTGREWGWTAAGNIDGLPTVLAALNPPSPGTPASPEEDIDVPGPGTGGTPGLPEKPALENAEFDAIVHAMEQMEQSPLAVEKKHGEETGDERTQRVEQIAGLRQRIAALGASISDPGLLKEAQAYLYRRLAPLAPYYNQMANTNILELGDKAWMRTCNVTVPAMVVEGIGKTKDDYDSSQLPLLRKVFDALEGKYKTRQEYEAASDFDALRLPDFMALVGIARHISNPDSLDDKQFAGAVVKARKKAAEKTTTHETMMYLIEAFGADHKKYSVHSQELGPIGEALKMYTKAELRGQNPEEWRDLYNRIQAIESKEERAAAFEKLSKTDKKRYQTLWNYEQLNKEKAEELLPVDTYRQSVLKKVIPLLNQGAQILVGMENHFIRLDALDQETIQVDDPGEKGFKNLKVTWDQARNMGYFKGFWAITG